MYGQSKDSQMGRPPIAYPGTVTGKTESIFGIYASYFP